MGSLAAAIGHENHCIGGKVFFCFLLQKDNNPEALLSQQEIQGSLDNANSLADRVRQSKCHMVRIPSNFYCQIF